MSSNEWTPTCIKLPPNRKRCLVTVINCGIKPNVISQHAAYFNMAEHRWFVDNPTHNPEEKFHSIIPHTTESRTPSAGVWVVAWKELGEPFKPARPKEEKWVSYDKKQPQEHGRYLVTYVWDDIKTVGTFIWHSDYHTFMDVESKRILAWRDLPEPYGETP